MNEHRNSADIANEGMNNFYCNFPGGSYRLGADFQFQGGVNHIGTVALHELCRDWLDKPEETWPGGIAGSIRAYKRGLEIQEAVDEALSQISLIADWWDAWRPHINQGMKVEVYKNLERMIIRPVWVRLRQQGFSRNELAS
jgi:hypothetical protein